LEVLFDLKHSEQETVQPFADFIYWAQTLVFHLFLNQQHYQFLQRVCLC